MDDVRANTVPSKAQTDKCVFCDRKRERSPSPVSEPVMNPWITPNSLLQPLSARTEVFGKIVTDPMVVEACFSAMDG